jgi:glycine/D-amino acid oxidase-like deaminating enzyme
MEDDPDPGRIPELTDAVFAYAGVRHAARVDVAELVSAFRQKLVAEGRFSAEVFDYAKVPGLLGAAAGDALNLPNSTSAPFSRTTKKVDGSEARYDHIICCEGWRARHNPYFRYLPHGGNKGEVLIVKTTAPVLDRMFKHRIFLVPLADGTYWVGATSENQFPDDSPTPVNRQFLEDRLAEILTGTDYEIVNHRAAVRPTVKDRRMIIGTHPDFPKLHILNGLGTKGASLAPLGSRWLVEHLLEGTAIPGEVDIRRF